MPALDIATVITEHGADWQLDANGDLVLETGLTTSVIHSLFSDRRLPAGEVHPVSPGDDPRGWWADNADREVGSLLWLLDRALVSKETRVRAEAHATEALQWLVAEQIAASVDVTAEWARGGVLVLTVLITRGSAARWPSAWKPPAAELSASDRLRVRFMTR